ncbi:NAD(P)-dependent glycerol-3-phosphate dehydrogenase [Treponema phagedenis]|uniref:Glycerol-3-phosphate dehydrogenase [NAD(P)+] n=1 Tax=Treponema phagedenis TaxID=162 RepID=A0A0B7GXJ9_TREPH|nr:NAD(P)H-dependent glycerol-3-phosphate dehydrogenase [Treponema phagedenis]NVP24241.1 NAD(P)-dependent glycerol-3-phosphate dehydrogenase [Treponema phagedenis]QEJ99196.1 NAD(P)-dependent glycerol-3-phosphate dehydrogenase [Treponema phagedenis]QEK00176.1 NAD(P)-dependent glycerol-3-phosphate dehydrogenase [Treponema phagedenis]QEK04763.1 NAD(P)-dependent glycerol-3-phosphate dehydrogenase [Treponema phagedenis]QEK07670.1 NAD(P)-dependent glycerol-3-phosphate dehydrogenase [Treponema phaged
MAQIGIISAGAWGTAVGVSLAKNGQTVELWGRSEQVCRLINAEHINPKYLPGINLPKNLKASTDLEKVCAKKDLIILAPPSLYLADIVKKMIKTAAFSNLTNESFPSIGILTKGFVTDSNGEPKLITQELETILPEFYKNHLVYISGPSHGEEVALGKITGLIAASNNPMSAIRVRELLRSKSLQVYSSLDPIGVQVCAAVKNVIAVAFGILDAITDSSEIFGDNTESLLLAAGLNEIQIIGRALGATHPETFTSIAGVGDLDVTCRSKYGRNRRFGRDIVHKNILSPFKNIEDLIKRLPEVQYLAEGVIACKYVKIIAENHGLKLPICTGLYSILNKEESPQGFVEKILV